MPAVDAHRAGSIACRHTRAAGRGAGHGRFFFQRSAAVEAGALAFGAVGLFGAVGTRNPVGPVATVFPEFIARDGQERADGGRQGGKRRVGAARRRSRGHGPARLDGTRARATVAVKVMKSGETAGHGNGHPTRRPHGKRSAQAGI